MDSNEPDDKILNVEEEFLKISVILNRYIDELHESQNFFIQNLTEIQQKAELVPLTLETLKSDSLALSNAVSFIQQDISQLNTNFVKNQKIELVLPTVETLKSDSLALSNALSFIQQDISQLNANSIENQQNLIQRLEILESDIKEINTKYRDFQDRTNEFFVGFPGLMKLSEDSYRELKQLHSQQNVKSVGDQQNILQKLEILESGIKEINTQYKDFENKLKLINDRVERFENISATYFTEISDQIINGFNQVTTTKDNYLINFGDVHRTLTSDIATNQEIINRLSKIDGNNITILAKNIDTILSELETQNRAIQEINSRYQDNISRLEKMNYSVRRQNAILMVLVVIFIALSVIIAVAFK